jgi:hypothetical protein
MWHKCTYTHAHACMRACVYTNQQARAHSRAHFTQNVVRFTQVNTQAYTSQHTRTANKCTYMHSQHTQNFIRYIRVV